MTVLTREWYDLALILDMSALRGQVTPSIVGAWTGDHAQLTHRNSLVLVIIVFNVSDVPCEPIGL